MKKIGIALLLLFLMTLSACGNNNDEESLPNDPVEDTQEADEKPIIKEIPASLESIDYNKEKGYLDISIDASLPEETEVLLNIENTSEDVLYSTKAYIEEDKLVGKIEEEEDIFIENGTYNLQGIVEVNEDNDSNVHLVDEYGEYEDVSKRYELSENIEQTNGGYSISIITDKNLIIEDAYEDWEVVNLLRDRKRATAKSPNYTEILDDNPSYEGVYVKYSGWIMGVTDNEGEGPNRLLVGYRKDDKVDSMIHNYTSQIFSVELPGTTNLDDFRVEGGGVTVSIELYGYVQGLYTYTNKRKDEKTVPNVVLEEYQVYYSEEEFDNSLEDFYERE